MQLDRTRIVIRERGFLEIMDLALSVIRGHAWPVFAAWLAGAVPLALFNHFLLREKLSQTELDFDAPAGYIWHLFVLMAAEIPLGTALITLYLGQALFEEQPTLGQVLRLFWSRLGQLFWVQGVLRGGGAVLAVGLYLLGADDALVGVVEFFVVLLWLLFWVLWPYLNEVLLLERNPLRKSRGGTSTISRALSMHSYAAADLVGRWLISVIVGGLLLASLWLSLIMLRRDIALQTGFDEFVYAVFIPLATWIVIGYFAVVRFLSYLDLRIRSEGWEVELAMRAEKRPNREAIGMNAAIVMLAIWTTAQAEAEPGVESGRKAFADSGVYPWYDTGADDLRRIDVQSASQPWQWNPSFSGPGSFSFVEVLLWSIIALVIGLLIFLLIRAYLNRETRPATGVASRAVVSDASRIEALPFKLRRDESDLLAAARRHYEAGQYGEAIVYLFSHQLVELDRNQVIRLTRGKTNRQYLREVKARPTLRGIMEQTMVAFEDVFFGNHALERPQFEACWQRLDEFANLARQGAA